MDETSAGFPVLKHPCAAAAARPRERARRDPTHARGLRRRHSSGATTDLAGVREGAARRRRGRASASGTRRWSPTGGWTTSRTSAVSSPTLIEDVHGRRGCPVTRDRARPAGWSAVRDRLRPARRGDRQGPVRRGLPHRDGVAAPGDQRAGARRRRPPAVRRPHAARLAGRARLRRQPRADELGDLPVLLPHPARHRRDHRVHRPADPGAPRLAPRPRPRLGRCWPRSGSPSSASSGPGSTWPASRTPCSRAPRGRRTSC